MVRNYKKFTISESFIIKLLRVPVELHLNEVLAALQGKLKTIMSIFRIYDYVNQQRCDEVVLTIRDPLEYQALKAMQTILIGHHEVRLEFRDWYFGAASRPTFIATADAAEIGASPISLKLSGLTEVSRVTTEYMLKIMTAFESWDNQNITGITFVYDAWRDAIRPFGFVAFVDVKSMMQFNNQVVSIFDEHISCAASVRVPILLSEPNKVLLEPLPAMFSKELCDANLLNDTPLARSGSQSSLAAAVEAMNIDEVLFSDEPLGSEEIEFQHDVESDNDSILSLDFSYDFDENMNLVKKF